MMHVLDPQRRPRQDGTYHSQLMADDGTLVDCTLTVVTVGGQKSYELHLADGTLVDTLDRRFRHLHGSTGWWGIVGPETYWGHRADDAYEVWLLRAKERMASLAVV